MAPAALAGAWEATQELLRAQKISAGHDISDGGIVTALLEMAFSGNVGLTVKIPSACNVQVVSNAGCTSARSVISTLQCACSTALCSCAWVVDRLRMGQQALKPLSTQLALELCLCENPGRGSNT